MFVFLVVRPALLMLQARNWPAVPCTIISSEVRTSRGNKGSTYSVNILYSYSFKGREYKSNDYAFIGASSSGYDSKAAIVARFPPGSTTVCYINPSDPIQAVLVRGFTPIMWIGLLPLVFLLIGTAGIVAVLRKSRTPGSAMGPNYEPIYGMAAPTTGSLPVPAARGERIIKPAASALKKFAGIVFAALFWNGIISVFLLQILKGWHSGAINWFLTIFMIPFVLVGLGLIAGTGYFFLALFNPRPQLTMTPPTPKLGDSLKIEWNLKGRVEALQNLRVTVQGREEATYSRGTQTVTDTNVFVLVEVAQVTNAQEIRSGSASATIPSGLMHSFVSRHNKIVWSIRMDGEIPRWPDLKEEFLLTVLPQKAEQPFV